MSALEMLLLLAGIAVGVAAVWVLRYAIGVQRKLHRAG